MIRTLSVALILLALTSHLSFAETIILKSGKTVEGEIVEETQDYIKLQTLAGQSLYYYKNTIETILSEGRVSDTAASSTPRFKTGLIDRTNNKRGYMLFVPKDIGLAASAPVFICLPGWGVSAKQDINMWRFPAEKNGFVVINLDVDYNYIKTDSGVAALYRRITDIIDSLVKEYPLDVHSGYIAGTSAGGMMSIALSLMFPDKFRAVGVVSGGRLGFGAKSNLRNAWGQHYYMVHGKLDKSIPVKEFYSTKAKLKRNGAKIEFEVVPLGEHTLASQFYRDVVDWIAEIERN